MKILIYSCVGSILFFSLTFRAFGQSSEQDLLNYVLVSNEPQPYNNQYSTFAFKIVGNKIMLAKDQSYTGFIWFRYLDEKIVEDMVTGGYVERVEIKSTKKRKKTGVGMYKKFLEGLTVNDWFYQNVVSKFQNRLSKIIDFDSVKQAYAINPNQIFQSYVSDVPNIQILNEYWMNRENYHYSDSKNIVNLVSNNAIQENSGDVHTDYMIRDFLLEVVDGVPTGNVKVLNVNKRELFGFNYKEQQDVIQIYQPFLGLKLIEIKSKDASTEISLFDNQLEYFHVKLNEDDVQELSLKDNFSRNLLSYQVSSGVSTLCAFDEGILKTKIIHRNELDVDEHFYYEMGILRKSQNYKSGIKYGSWNYYNEIGNISKLETWNKDLLNGDYKEWDDEGKILTEGIFRDGLKEKDWKKYRYIERKDIFDYNNYLKGLLNQENYEVKVANETWENGILINCKGDCNEED